MLGKNNKVVDVPHIPKFAVPEESGGALGSWKGEDAAAW